LTLPLRRKLTRLLSPEPRPGERVTWFAKVTSIGLIWSLATVALAAVALLLLPGTAPLRGRFQVLAVLWFLALYQVISATLQAFVQPGSFRRRVRRGVVPAMVILAVFDHLSLLRPVMGWLDQPLMKIQDTNISLLSVASSLLITIGFFPSFKMFSI